MMRNDTKKEIEEIAREYVPLLSQAIWNYDTRSIDLALKGMTENRFVSRVELLDEDGVRQKAVEGIGGTRMIGEETRYPLVFEPANLGPMPVGTLVIRSSREAERGNTLGLVAFSVCLNVSIVASLFLVLKIYASILIGRPLRSMVGQLRTVDVLAAGRPIISEDKDRQEEFAVIAAAVNSMGERICESEGQFRVLFEHSPVSLWDEDFSAVRRRIDEAREAGVEDWAAYFASDERVAEFLSLVVVRNTNRATMSLIARGEDAPNMFRLAEILPPRTLGVMRDELVALASGRTFFEGDIEYSLPSGDDFFGRVSLSVVPGYEGSWSRVLLSLVDLSERRRLEKVLERSEAKYRGVMEQFSEGIALIDASGKVVDSNTAMTGLYDFEEGLRSEGSWGERIRECMEGLPTGTLERTVAVEGGTERVIELKLFPIRLGIEFLGGLIARDVTEQRAASRSLMHSLREKEILLHEIHHRVKNNLQIICSLLHLESESPPEAADGRTALLDMEARVAAMALVHDMLYMSEELSYVDFRDYTRQLCESIVAACGADRDKVVIEQSVEGVRLSLDKAIPCGLMINEIVVNAAKRAVSKGERVAMRISMSGSGGIVALEISEGGRAGSRPLSGIAKDSLGLSLVKAFAAQLNGKLDLTAGSASLRMEFPEA